jgi:hypothetical protein
MVGLLTVLPDTQLWRRLSREGRLLTESTGNNTDASLNFIPKMDSSRLIEGYKTILRTIYSPGEYYKRAFDCLERTQAMFEPSRRSLLSNITALTRVILALGIQDQARGEFWRFVHRVFTKRRERLEYALTLAAMGYHFRKLTDLYCS